MKTKQGATGEETKKTRPLIRGLQPFLAPGTGFVEDNFSTDQSARGGRGRGGGLFKCITLLHTLFLLLLNHHHLRVPGIRSWRLGTPALWTSGVLQLHTFTYHFSYLLLLPSPLKPISMRWSIRISGPGSIVVALQSLSYGQLFVTPWPITHQSPLSTGFSRPEYWHELPFPSPEDLPDPESNP